MAEVAERLAQDGVVVVPGLLPPRRCAELVAVVQRLRSLPGPSYRVLSPPDEPTVESDLFRFRDVAEIAELVRTGPLVTLAARALRTDAVVVLEDQWFASAAGSAIPSPWHQDDPYHPLDREFLTIWLPLTSPPPGTVLRGVLGSHRRAVYAPVEFSASAATLGPDMVDTARASLERVPDVDADPVAFPVLVPQVTPGDAVLLDSRTLHAAGGFCAADFVRLSIRYAHPATRYRSRPWAVAAFWDEHPWHDGDPLASERFPLVAPTLTA